MRATFCVTFSRTDPRRQTNWEAASSALSLLRLSTLGLVFRADLSGYLPVTDCLSLVKTSPKSCGGVRHLSGGLSFQKLRTVFQLDILQGSPVSLITRGEERAGDGSPPYKLLLGGPSAVEANRGPELNLINIHYPGRSSLESKLLTRWMIRRQEGCEMVIQRRMSRAATMRRKHRGLVCQFHSASCTRPDVTPLKAWEVET